MKPEPVPVILFPKKCPHGKTMKLVEKLSGAWWYEVVCDLCTKKKADDGRVA